MQTLAAITTLDRGEVFQAEALLASAGNRMQLKVPNFVGVGTAVKIESDDVLALGEVSYCKPESDGFVVWVELIEALRNVSELTRLARALVG